MISLWERDRFVGNLSWRLQYGTRHPIRRHENYRVSSSNLFRFSLGRTFRIFCFVFISIIGVSVSLWSESIYVNGLQRRGCGTLRKIQISFRLFIDIPLLISSRLFARSYFCSWPIPLSEFREDLKIGNFFLIKLVRPTLNYRWKNSFARDKMHAKHRKVDYF